MPFENEPVISTPLCKVDYREAPGMKEFAAKAAQVGEKYYPLVYQKLYGITTSAQLTMVFKNDLSFPGITYGSVINLSIKWFTEHPDDLGAIVHEIAHVAQAYPAGQPAWLVEGIADYIRYWAGFKNSWSYPHCGLGSPHYTSGYWCSAAFLQFVERVYDKTILMYLNAALRNNSYNDSLFQSYTNKSLAQLWEESKNAECAGGSP
jgi:hypothetical protein